MTDSTQGAATRASSRRILIALWSVVLLLTIAGAVSFVLYSRRHAPQPTLVAVAPFDIFVAGLDPWRIGLAEGMTQRIAQPPFTTVPQSVIARTWRGTARPEIAALEVARRTGAGVALYGRVDSLGPDSVRVNVVAVDAITARVRFGVQLRHPARDPEVLAALLAEHVRHRLTAPDTASSALGAQPRP